MVSISDRLSGAMAFRAFQPLDGHGFADLIMTTRRPAAHLGPLNRVGHLVAREEVFFQNVTPILRKNRLIIEVSALTPRSADRQSQRA